MTAEGVDASTAGHIPYL